MTPPATNELKKIYKGHGVFADLEFGRILFGENTPYTPIRTLGKLVVLSGENAAENEMYPGFKIYGFQENGNDPIEVILWEVDDDQLELAWRFNLKDRLFKRTVKTWRYEDTGESLFVVSDIYTGTNGEPVSGIGYNRFLNGKERTLAGARGEREAYYREYAAREGNHRSSQEKK